MATAKLLAYSIAAVVEREVASSSLVASTIVIEQAATKLIHMASLYLTQQGLI